MYRVFLCYHLKNRIVALNFFILSVLYRNCRNKLATKDEPFDFIHVRDHSMVGGWVGGWGMPNDYVIT